MLPRYIYLVMLGSISQVMFSQSLQLEWMQEYPSNKSSSLFNKVLTDNNGNVYTCGESYSLPFSTAFLSLKYDSLGNLLWDAKFDYFFPDLMRDCELSETGLVVAGTVSDLNSGWNRALMISYDENGTELWSRYLYDIEEYASNVLGMEIDETNNIYAFGASLYLDTMTNGTEYMFIDKINAVTGETVWSCKYHDGESSFHYAFDGKVVGDKIRVVGKKHKMGTLHYVLLEISLEGELLSVASFPWPEDNGFGDLGRNVCLDVDGDMIIAGKLICKMQISGDTVWCFDFSEEDSGFIGKALSSVSDEEDNILSTGWVQDTISKVFFTKTVLINGKSGEENWANKDNLFENATSETGINICFSDKYVLVGGDIWFGEYPDYLRDSRIILYSRSNGAILSDTLIDVRLHDGMKNVYFDGKNFYMVGVAYNQTSSTENKFQSVFKFSVNEPLPVSLLETSDEVPQIHPNPTTGLFTLWHDGIQNGDVEMYDLQGQLVFSEKANGIRNEFDVSRLVAGVYILKFSDKNSSFFKKLIKVNN